MNFFSKHTRPMQTRNFVAALAMALLLATGAMAEEDCGLTQYASVSMLKLSNGDLGIPVTIAGKEQTVALGLKNPYSYFLASYVKSAGFQTAPMPEGMSVNFGLGAAEAIVTIPLLRIEGAGAKDALLLEVEHVRWTDGTVGELGLDLLSKFDVELDFANNKFNLYSSNHCPGKAVYWSDTYAPVPLVMDPTGLTCSRKIGPVKARKF